MMLVHVFVTLAVTGYLAGFAGWLARDPKGPISTPLLYGALSLFALHGMNTLHDLPGPLLVWFAWPVIVAITGWRKYIDGKDMLKTLITDIEKVNEDGRSTSYKDV